MVALTCQFDNMALMESSIQRMRKERFRFDHYDKLFDQLIDSDSFGLSDEVAADRRSSDDWGTFFELPESCNGNDIIRPQKLDLPVLEIPDRERHQNSTISRVSERIVSLADLDSIQNPTHPHPSALLNRRKIKLSGESNSAQGLRSHPAGVSKAAQKTTASPKMTHRHNPKREKKEKSHQRGDNTAGDIEPPRARQRPISAAPPSNPTVQTTWSPAHPYQLYGQPSDAPALTHNELVFRHNSGSPSQQTYSQPTYSPLSSPRIEHSSSEDMTNYYHSPGTPYFTEADALTPHDFGSYSTLSRERGFPLGQQQSQHPGLEMGYGPQDFADTQVQPWWIPTSAGQPYHPNLAYPVGSDHPAQHAIPATAHQSDYGLQSGGLMIKRDHDAPDTNFRNSGGSRGPSYAHDPSEGDIGYRKTRQEQPHRRSSSPSAASLPTRDTTSSSSSTRTGGVHHKRSKAAGASGRRDPQPAGFVNYTPEDSKKILTGVAPSGSSKTKARREKEAAEKQRKLSLAAARAVIEAGGDLEALEREGFLIEKDDEEEEEGSP